jgi:hypothetical protein
MSFVTTLEVAMLEGFGEQLRAEGVSDDLRDSILDIYGLERLPSPDSVADQIRSATATS